MTRRRSSNPFLGAGPMVRAVTRHRRELDRRSKVEFNPRPRREKQHPSSEEFERTGRVRR